MSDYEERIWKIPHTPFCHLFLELLSPLCLSFLICEMRIRQGWKSVWHIIRAHKAVVIIISTVTSKHLNKGRLSTIHLVQPTTTFLNTIIPAAKSCKGLYKEMLFLLFYLKNWTDFFSNNSLHFFFWNKLYIQIYPFIAYSGYSWED